MGVTSLFAKFSPDELLAPHLVWTILDSDSPAKVHLWITDAGYFDIANAGINNSVHTHRSNTREMITPLTVSQNPVEFFGILATTAPLNTYYISYADSIISYRMPAVIERIIP